MFLKVKIYCPCGCSYTVNANICIPEISCPNCGTKYPYSEQLVSIFKLAKEIPDGNIFEDEHTITVISPSEDMKNPQH